MEHEENATWFSTFKEVFGWFALSWVAVGLIILFSHLMKGAPDDSAIVLALAGVLWAGAGIFSLVLMALPWILLAALIAFFMAIFLGR